MIRPTVLSLASVLLIRLVAVGVVTAQEIAVRPSIAIADVAITPGGSTLPPAHLSQTIVELLMGELVTSQRFQVYDGQWLVGAGEAGHPDLARLRAAAAQHHVDYLVLGSITAFDTEQAHRRIGGIVPKPFLLGGLSRNRAHVRIGMSFRMVDVRTGAIVATASGDGVGTRRGTTVGGGGFVKGLPIGALVSATRSWSARDAMLNEAVQRAVHAAAQSLAGVSLAAARSPLSSSPIGHRESVRR